MPRVYTRTAGKDYPAQGIQKGDTYYAWSFYRQAERKSKTYPKPSQLTNVDTEATMLAAYEVDGFYSPEDVRTLIEALEEARDGEQEKFDNMPEGFQQGDQGQRIEAHVSALEDAISSLEEIEGEWQDYSETLDENGEPTEASQDHEHHERDWENDIRETQPDWE